MQIRPVRILTGGNVRLIALIARFGAKRSFRELLEDLIDLIDEHTDYFKSHLDNMAPTERKVYLALAELWNPSTAKEIAEVARLDVNTTSALLKRLASRGKIIVEEEGKRKRWYSISEGIYNIYYLMRRRGGPSARVKAVVRFMTSLYEAVPGARLVLDESNSLKPDECRNHITALAEIYRSAQSIQRIEIAKSIPSAVIDSPYLENDIREEMIANDTAGNRKNETEKILNEMSTQFDTASRLYHQHNYVSAIDILAHLIEQFGQRQEAPVVKMNMVAKILRAKALLKLDRHEEVLADVMAFIDHQTYIDYSILILIVNLFVELAAYGYAEKALEILVSSETQRHIEPLVAGLRLYCGQVVRTSTEILEVAEDVVKRIEARKQELDDQRFESSSVDVNC